MPEQQDIEQSETELSDRPRSRLEPITEQKLGPWRKSLSVDTCHLYWMPTEGPPVSFRQKQWCLSFFTHLRERLFEAEEMQSNLFLQMKVLYPDLMDSFLRNATRFAPVLGLSRRRGASLPQLPNDEYVEKLQQGKIKYDHKAIQPDYCYWFLKAETQEQTQLYFGLGGLMMLFAKPPEQEKVALPTISPGVAAHPQFAGLLANGRLEKMMETLVRMKSPLFPKTKAVFGRGLEEELQYPAMKFIVPLLSAQDFSNASPAEIEEWFTVFDVVVTESPVDKGLLLASKYELDMDLLLQEVVETMRENSEVYPEFG